MVYCIYILFRLFSMFTCISNMRFKNCWLCFNCKSP